MVLRGLPAVAVRPELLLRRRPVGLLEPARPVALPLLEAPDRSHHARGACDRGALRHRRGAGGAVVGELDGAGQAVTRGTFLLAGIFLATSAHVGSPDTYFEGAAGAPPPRGHARHPPAAPRPARATRAPLGGAQRPPRPG